MTFTSDANPLSRGQIAWGVQFSTFPLCQERPEPPKLAGYAARISARPAHVHAAAEGEENG